MIRNFRKNYDTLCFAILRTHTKCQNNISISYPTYFLIKIYTCAALQIITFTIVEPTEIECFWTQKYGESCFVLFNISTDLAIMVISGWMSFQANYFASTTYTILVSIRQIPWHTMTNKLQLSCHLFVHFMKHIFI